MSDTESPVTGQSQDDPVNDPETEPEPSPGPIDEPRVQVIVVGSFDWASPATVVDVLDTWWTNHGQPPAQIITSGCPHGAEAIAREYAMRNNWQLVQVRDEELVTLTNAIAFVFIKDHSPGAEKALGWIEMAKLWHRIHREETVRQVSPWADR